jgi:5-methylcytosine-specific restriction endonuclease McrA
MYKTEDKVINVIGKDDRFLSCCTRNKALKMVNINYALWIDETSIKLLIDNRDRKRLRKQILKEAQNICYICDKKIIDESPTIDHVISKAQLGPDNKINWKCCCRKCNEDKGRRTLKQYVFFIYKTKSCQIRHI